MNGLYDNGRIYVCTIEPYHDNSEVVGVTGYLSDAMWLHGHPDPDDWTKGSGSNTAEDRPAWHRADDDGYTTLQIVEAVRYGAFDPAGPAR